MGTRLKRRKERLSDERNAALPSILFGEEKMKTFLAGVYGFFGVGEVNTPWPLCGCQKQNLVKNRYRLSTTC